MTPRNPGAALGAMLKIFAVLLLLYLIIPSAPARAGEAAPSQPGPEVELPDDLDYEDEPEAYDPIEGWNRAVFKFNDVLYFALLKPTVRVYNTLVPEPGRVGVRNFFRNITTPVRLVSLLLQGNLKGAGVSLARFGVNSTFGVLGLIDAAGMHLDLEYQDEDLGQAFGAWGLAPGAYLVWPVLGPSTVRDSVGMVGDGFLNPVYYLDDKYLALGIRAGEGFNDASLHEGEYEEFKEASIEPYIAMRNIYLQYRRAKVSGEEPEAKPPGQ